jgi:hypothetical protein
MSSHDVIGWRRAPTYIGRTFAYLRRAKSVCTLSSRQSYRWVEAAITVPSLGTGGGRSQWCNRLPEIVMTSVAGSIFVGGSSRGMRRRQTVLEACGSPSHQAQATELKDLVEDSQG